MSDYPFIYLNHGEINPESIGKNEEIFIWFKREVTKSEQEKIMENCPPPLSCVLCWGKEFLYFGSGGDTYDFEIMQTYAYEESMAFTKIDGMDEGDVDNYLANTDFEDVYQTAIEVAIPHYAKALENWIMEVHEIVPIVFFNAPNNPEEQDDWAVWSEANIYNTTLPYINNYREKYPKIFEGENEELRFFGYIFKFLCHYIKTENRDLQVVLSEIELSFDLDGIHEAFDRLNMEDSQLQGNCNTLLGVMESLSSEERVAYINNLKPYTQLAYYASYAANRNHDILVHKDPIAYLKKLIEGLPASRKDVVGTYLRFAGENLVHIGPAFREEEKKDKTHAGLAAQLLELGLAHGNTIEGFINCAAFYDWQNDYESMLRVSLEGVKKLADNNTLIANILYAAEKCGKNDIVAEYVNRKSEDPMILANQSYSLVISGKNKEANDLLLGHFKKGGSFNEYSLNNLLYLCSEYQQPEEKLMKAILDLSIKNMVEQPKYRNVDFMNNLIKLVNNTGDYGTALELFSNYKTLGGKVNCSICCGYSYAASMLRDKAIIQKCIDIVWYEYEENSYDFESEEQSYYILMGNISGMYAVIGNKEKMLEFLERTKKVHPNFMGLKEDSDFTDYWKDKDFLNLFK